MRIEILNDADEVIRVIEADETFAEAHYPGKWRASEVQAAPAPTSWYITRLAFRSRFTPAEKAALYNAAAVNVDIRVYLDDVNAATFIDLQRADTVAGVQTLEAAGLIGVGRATAILTTLPRSEEVWRGA